jgi:hypothetical protein
MVKFPPFLPIAALTVRLVVLVVPLPVVASTSSPIATCLDAEIKTSIGKLVTVGEEQNNAIAALSQCSNAADDLTWELENSDSDQVRWAAVKVLGQIATPDVIESLASGLFQPDARTRFYVAATLGEIGWEAESTVDDLIRVSQGDIDPNVRQRAVLALAAIARDSEAYVNQLQGWQVGEIQELQMLQERLQTQVLEGREPDANDASQEGTTAEDLDSLQRATGALQRQLRGLIDRPTYQVVSWEKLIPG